MLVAIFRKEINKRSYIVTLEPPIIGSWTIAHIEGREKESVAFGEREAQRAREPPEREREREREAQRAREVQRF